MHNQQYHVSYWLKLCFCSLAVIIFGTITIPNKTYAAEMVETAGGIDLENFEGDLESLSSLPLAQRKQLYKSHRWSSGANFMDYTNTADWNKLAEELDDNHTVSCLLLDPACGSLTISRLVGEDTLEGMNPRFLNCLVTSSGEWNMTPLMALALMDTRENFAQKLALLRSHNIDISQQDSFGNTAEGMSTLDMISLAARRFTNRNLDSSLWQAIADDRYVGYLNVAERYCSSLYPRDFVKIGFKVILTQARTVQRQAFLQQDVSTEELRTVANDLWTGFFNVYDSLLDDEEREEQQKYSLGRRALELLFFLDLEDDDLQEMGSNIIAHADSFPSKKVELSHAEILEAAQLTRNAIDTLIASRLSKKSKNAQPSDNATTELVSFSEATMLEEIEVIKRMFIGKKSYHELDETEKRERPMYHLWCTVKALQSFSWQRYATYNDVSFCNEEGIYDYEKVLDFLDENLSSHIPTGMVENGSRALFQELLAFPESIES